MNVKSQIYKTIIHAFNALPVRLRGNVFNTWKKSGLPYTKFYKDLRFEGKLEVQLRDTHFYMQASGGTVENEIYWKGIYRSLEPESIWLFEQLIKSGITSVVDVGANTGVYSLFSYALNPKLTIVAFEPSRKTFSKLKSNVELNQYSITLENIALSNSVGSALFYDTCDENQTNASLSSKMLKENPNAHVEMDEYEVAITTFDAYYSQSVLEKVDFIKIDVELYEAEVLEGMVQTIRKEHPYLLFEVLTEEVVSKINVIMNELPGYELYEFVTTDGNYKMRRVEKLTGKGNYDWNYFACHSTKAEQLKPLMYP